MRPIENALQRAKEIADRFKHRRSIDNFVIDMALLIDDGYRDGVRDTLEKCARVIRESCVACSGTGCADYESAMHGAIPEECEYCGRPIAAIGVIPIIDNPKVDNETM